MTTTTKTATGKQSKVVDAVEGEWADAPKASTMSDFPQWMPQLCIFKAEAVAEKLAAQPEGSHAEKVLIGRLSIERAFGEPRYHVTGADGQTMGLPLHGVLTSALDCVDMSAAPRVRLAYLGEAPRARPGERAAFLYDIRVLPKEALLSEPREDPPALLPIHKENKDAREEANAKKGKGKGKGKSADIDASDD